MELIDYFRILKTIIILFLLYICKNNVLNQNVKVQEETLRDSHSDAVKTTLRLYVISKWCSLSLKFFKNFSSFLCQFVTRNREYHYPRINKDIHTYIYIYFLLVCFVILKEKTCETRKNVFYFTSKALFVLEIIKF